MRSAKDRLIDCLFKPMVSREAVGKTCSRMRERNQLKTNTRLQESGDCRIRMCGVGAARRKMLSVDSSQFTLGPCHFSDAPLFRPLKNPKNSHWSYSPLVRKNKPSAPTSHCSERLLDHGITISLYHYITISLYHYITIRQQSLSPPCRVFNLDFRESKPKFLSPNSFSTMAEITPTTSLCVESLWKYQSRRTQCRLLDS